jgi:predicted ATP-binding protein involved in virulence
MKIMLSDDERKHLIVTGKNGSGKTSLLEAIGSIVSKFCINSHETYLNAENSEAEIGIEDISMSLNQRISTFEDLGLVFIPAQRSGLALAKAVGEPLEISNNLIAENASKNFIQYLVNLDYQLYGAQMDGNIALQSSLKSWFENFEETLRVIYNCKELVLRRDTKKRTFIIDLPSHEPFALNGMSDGYSALLKIVMELLLRFEVADAVVNYEKSAIVMIDEIETHLHVELQRKVLPFLTKMFPNVQFIVSTHSPFVISSLENAIVFDLEKKERLEKPSFYSYDTIVESFLDTSSYSDEFII